MTDADDLASELEGIEHDREVWLMRAARNECDYECTECGTHYGGMPEQCPEQDEECTANMKLIRLKAC